MVYKRFITILVSAALLGGVLAAAPWTAPSARAAAQEGSTEVERITLDEFKALLANNTPVTVIDVRGPSTSKIKGAIHIPLSEIESRLNEIPRDREVVTYCA
jgi:hypothetical protein